MRSFIYSALFIVTSFLFLWNLPMPACFADTIHLKNGSILEGEVVDRTDKYIVISIPISERELTSNSASADLDLNKEVYFSEIANIQYSSGEIEDMTQEKKDNEGKDSDDYEEESLDDDFESTEYPESGKAGDLVSYELEDGVSIAPDVQIMVNNKAGQSLPFAPDVMLENKDGVISDVLQERNIVLREGLDVYYTGLDPFGVEKPPLLYKVKEIEIDSERSAKIILELGSVVKKWSVD